MNYRWRSSENDVFMLVTLTDSNWKRIGVRACLRPQAGLSSSACRHVLSGGFRTAKLTLFGLSELKFIFDLQCSHRKSIDFGYNTLLAFQNQDFHSVLYLSPFFCVFLFSVDDGYDKTLRQRGRYASLDESGTHLQIILWLRTARIGLTGSFFTYVSFLCLSVYVEYNACDERFSTTEITLNLAPRLHSSSLEHTCHNRNSWDQAHMRSF